VVPSLILGSGNGRDRNVFLESKSEGCAGKLLLEFEPPRKPISLESRCIPKLKNKYLHGFASGTRKTLRLNAFLEMDPLDISLTINRPAPESAYILAGD
jgi:hypothetical protein